MLDVHLLNEWSSASADTPSKLWTQWKPWSWKFARAGQAAILGPALVLRRVHVPQGLPNSGVKGPLSSLGRIFVTKGSDLHHHADHSSLWLCYIRFTKEAESTLCVCVCVCVWLRVCVCVCACVAETQDSQWCSSGLSMKGWEPGELMGRCQSKSQKPWGFGAGRDKSGTRDTLLSHFSHVRLCATPSLGFSRQEHWSGLPFPSPMHKSEKWKWSR